MNTYDLICKMEDLAADMAAMAAMLKEDERYEEYWTARDAAEKIKAAWLAIEAAEDDGILVVA